MAALAALWLVNSATAAEAAANDPGPLRVWTRSSNDGRKTYDAIAAAFTARTGIRVEYFNATTDFEQRLARAAVGRDLPDVIINDGGSLGPARQHGHRLADRAQRDRRRR